MKTKVLKEQALTSIVSLLDDDDETFELLQAQILELGSDAFDEIVEACPKPSALVRERLDSLRQTLNQDKLLRDFGAIPTLPNGDLDLEAGMFFLCRLDAPSLDVARYSQMLDQAAARIRHHISPESNSGEIVEAINRELFAESGFHGNEDDYYHPYNSFLHHVLESGRGLPLTLSVIYILVGKRLGFPVYGLGLPQHFIVQAGKRGEEMYIDPYAGGEPMSRDVAIEMIENMGETRAERYLKPVSNAAILERCCRNLQRAYTEHQDYGQNRILNLWVKKFEDAAGRVK